MMAADITTAPVKPTASRRSRGAPHVVSVIGAMTRWPDESFPVLSGTPVTCSQLELQFDDGAVATAGLEAQPAQQRPRPPVLPKCRGAEDREPVHAGARDQAADQHRPDSSALMLVRHRDGAVGGVGAVGYAGIPGHADDRAVATVDRGQRLVPAMIDAGQVGELPLAQCRLRDQEALTARFRAQPLEQRRDARAVRWLERPDAYARRQ